MNMVTASIEQMIVDRNLNLMEFIFILESFNDLGRNLLFYSILYSLPRYKVVTKNGKLNACRLNVIF